MECHFPPSYVIRRHVIMSYIGNPFLSHACEIVLELTNTALKLASQQMKASCMENPTAESHVEKLIN